MTEEMEVDGDKASSKVGKQLMIFQQSTFQSL